MRTAFHIHYNSSMLFIFLMLCFNLQLSVARPYQDDIFSWKWRHPSRSLSSSGREKRSPSYGPWMSVRAGSSAVSAAMVTSSPTSYYYGRVALAGGLAGATGTMVLYPMDCAKTLRQSNPTQFSSVRAALWHLIRGSATSASTTQRTLGWNLARAYRGWLPAAMGAIPSSALYFGAYESCKRILQDQFGVTDSPWWIHGLAAASGNTLSSAVFVPKEVLKQRLQYGSKSAVTSFPQVFSSIFREKGIRGFYVGYQATLMRNIPSAMVRFVLYEELKKIWSSPTTDDSLETKDSLPSRVRKIVPAPVGLFAAGAMAGALSSGIMTPIDVIKTRLATGTCPLGVENCFRHVLAEIGWKGLYAGAGSRMMWSGAFSAIGFGTFEVVKGVLGVATRPHSPP